MTPVRPRIEGEREDEILDATLELLVELGYDRLTMDAVAKAARASKATLYRRWETKASLVVDALIRAKQAPQVELPDTGSLRGDLLAMFCGGHGPSGQGGTRALGAVISGLHADPEFAELFRERFIAPKVTVSSQVYARARARGEIRADLDLEVIAPALAGVLLHRTFVLGLDNGDGFVERVIDHLILPATLAAPAGTPGTAPPATPATPTVDDDDITLGTTGPAPPVQVTPVRSASDLTTTP